MRNVTKMNFGCISVYMRNVKKMIFGKNDLENN